MHDDPALLGPGAPTWEPIDGLTVSVTGHRPRRIARDRHGWVQSELRRVMERLDPVRAVTGMAEGADLWFADAAREQDRRLAAIRPFPEQAARWSLRSRSHHAQMWQYATDRWTTRPAFTHDAYWVRNTQVVSVADVVVAVFDGNRGGGTEQAVRFARAQRLPIILIDPITMRTTRTAPTLVPA